MRALERHNANLGANELEGVLVQRAVGERDEKALAELFKCYQSRLFNFIVRLVGRREEAVELTQDTFLQAFVSFDRLKDPRFFRPWLYRIALNISRNHLRLAARRERPYEPTEHPSALWQQSARTPQEHLENSRDVAWANTILSKLSEKDRSLILLRRVEGMSYKELSRVFRVPGPVLKMRMHRALLRLNELVEEELQ